MTGGKTGEQCNVDWSAAFALAARDGPSALVRAMTVAMRHECVALVERYEDLLTRQRATCNEILAQQQAEFEQRCVTFERELLARIDNELGPTITTLRQELAAANAELARLRQLAAPQPVH
jgi:hypothetical protein